MEESDSLLDDFVFLPDGVYRKHIRSLCFGWLSACLTGLCGFTVVSQDLH